MVRQTRTAPTLRTKTSKYRMFDIGFAELVVIGVVGLLVIGPERLPGTIREASLWLNRLKRGFNDIKQEVKQELHNDSVLQELRKTGDQLKSEAERVGKDIQQTTQTLGAIEKEDHETSDAATAPPTKNAP
jgi:sec-independent protein translocase protein TatB